MITEKGFSKDPMIVPEGIAITFGKEMINDQGGLKNFLTHFLNWMDQHEEGDYWMHKCKNLPTVDIDHIYIIVANRLWGRVYCGGMRRVDPDNPETGGTATGDTKIIDWNYIILSGPFERCPFKRTLKGFQGFRYTTKLF
jgi:hypothetical protein